MEIEELMNKKADELEMISHILQMAPAAVDQKPFERSSSEQQLIVKPYNELLKDKVDVDDLSSRHHHAFIPGTNKLDDGYDSTSGGDGYSEINNAVFQNESQFQHFIHKHELVVAKMKQMENNILLLQEAVNMTTSAKSNGTTTSSSTVSSTFLPVDISSSTSSDSDCSLRSDQLDMTTGLPDAQQTQLASAGFAIDNGKSNVTMNQKEGRCYSNQQVDGMRLHSSDSNVRDSCDVRSTAFQTQPKQVSSYLEKSLITLTVDTARVPPLKKEPVIMRNKRPRHTFSPRPSSVQSFSLPNKATDLTTSIAESPCSSKLLSNRRDKEPLNESSSYHKTATFIDDNCVDNGSEVSKSLLNFFYLSSDKSSNTNDNSSDDVELQRLNSELMVCK